MKSLAIVNLKGGSGKTTTALCLAVGMARRGLRTLLIDADPQANATMTATAGEGTDGPTLGHVLLGQADAGDAIRPTRIAGLDVLPADARLADAALLLADQLGRERRLRRALMAADGDHEAIVIDSAPHLDLVAINVLNAVGGLVVPVDAGLYSVAGLARLQATVEDVRRHLDNPTLAIGGLVLTRAHRNRATADLEGQLRAAYGPLVFGAMIPHSVKVEEAHARHLTVLEYAPASAPSKAYQALLTEILDGDRKQGNPAARLGPDPAEADADAA